MVASVQQSNSWSYKETLFSLEEAAYKESLFAVGNGYLGIRGYFDEGYPDGARDTSAACFLNGVYESLPIEYDESAYGFAKNCHRIVPVPRQYFEILLDGTQFSFASGHIKDYQRQLDFKSGSYRRQMVWRAPNGKEIALCFERAASFTHESVAMFQLTINAINFSGPVTLRSVLDAKNNSINDEDDPRKGGTVPAENWRLQNDHHSSDGSYYHYQTRNSGIDVVAYLQTHLASETAKAQQGQERTLHEYTINAAQNTDYTVTSSVAYADSRKYPSDNLVRVTKAATDSFLALGYDAFKQQQTNELSKFWDYSDIKIDSQDGAQYATRFSLFHLFQSTGRDGLSSISAKGLTGAGYDGHYFWDSETYIFPFWLFSHPDIAKSLLAYRVNTLDSAKKRARELGHNKGALFAWRTIGGEECSSYFPAGTAQYHINADIAYATKSYFNATHDIHFMLEGLAEVILETARIWMDLGHFGRDGLFKIFAVTGPDEYTAVVNNNFYTNKMAQVHLQWACDVIDLLKTDHADFLSNLMTRIELSTDEIAQWQRGASKMYLPFDDAKNIFAQDDSFLEKPVWDFNNTPKEKYPLLLHFHPLVIYRHQVLKQADTLLALLLAGEDIETDIKRNCFDYYEPINTHDSTLSTCVHGVIANEIGYFEKAYEYYRETMNLDLENSHRNTYYGVHTAAMGGIWMGAIQGFAGMRYSTDQLMFKPRLPQQWQSLSFKMRYQARVIQINIQSKTTELTLLQGDILDVICHSNTITLQPDTLVTVNNPQ